MTENRSIWVFSEKPDLLAELIAGARPLAGAGALVALALGPRAAAEQAITYGADRVLWLGEAGPQRLVDDYLNTLHGLLEMQRPYLLIIGSTKQGRAIAGRLAARLDTTALTDVLEFSSTGGHLQGRHMIFGGGAVRVDQLSEGNSPPYLATVGSGVFHAQAAGAPPSTDAIEAVPFIEPDWQVHLRESKPRPPAAANLPAAKRVVCSGRGLARQEDLSMVKELAGLLRAEMACTRPLAEGLDWLPRERYIGISGATVKPDLYLGVGVSGQVQHLIGMSSSRLVVAINKDQNAPIFASADYGIADDLYAVVPKLIEALKARH